jgi:hypothetical protein
MEKDNFVTGQLAQTTENIYDGLIGCRYYGRTNTPLQIHITKMPQLFPNLSGAGFVERNTGVS